MPTLRVDFSKMNKKVIIEKKGRVPDGQGGWKDGWVKHCEMWAWPIARYAREIYKNRKMDEKIDMEFRVRFREDITSDMRLYYCDAKRYLHIDSIVDTLETRRRMEILCYWA
jgi:SPP1 family predicted phage head-tail adaptor